MGRKASEETRKKQSESHIGKQCGKNHPNWNPNLTDEDRIQKRKYPEYKKWRESVYNRDNYVCQICKDNKGGNLNAHHLDGHNNNPDKRILLENGVTLCNECHKDFHHQYGYGNNTKKQFLEFKVNRE